MLIAIPGLGSSDTQTLPSLHIFIVQHRECPMCTSWDLWRTVDILLVSLIRPFEWHNQACPLLGCMAKGCRQSSIALANKWYLGVPLPPGTWRRASLLRNMFQLSLGNRKRIFCWFCTYSLPLKISYLKMQFPVLTSSPGKRTCTQYWYHRQFHNLVTHLLTKPSSHPQFTLPSVFTWTCGFPLN